MTYKFYDTCSLLKKVDVLFDDKDESIIISSITLKELENIKTSPHKDVDVKYNARRLLHLLDENPDKYEVCIFTKEMLNPIIERDMPITDDLSILACALHMQDNLGIKLTFVTNDLALKTIAKTFIDNVESVPEELYDPYCGYKEIIMSNDDMAEFYSNPTANPYDLLINEYLIIYNEDGEQVDLLCWTGEDYRKVKFQTLQSKWFGSVKPLKGDPYQQIAVDSFVSNTITLIKGPAGAGKTYLSLAYLMAQLEHGKIDKIIIFCNTVAVQNSAKLGYYPGTRDEKLLDSQIGNLLISKLGGRIEVERMIADEKLLLLPLSDIRGYDTTGINAGIYICEAQNLDVNLMKIALQRIGNDSICIIDGDEKAQVDDIHFAGSNNGMKRMSKVFRGHDIYGEVELRKIHRSKIANIADAM